MNSIVSAEQYETSTLQNTYHKLLNDKELTIGYIGGSVTAGAGAENHSTDSWRALTTAWFKEQFPWASITEKCMAIGGTGTIYALHRMEKALLSGDLPDLVFIETAINDSYDDVSGDTLRVYFESVIRKIYVKNPKCDIVIVITGDCGSMRDQYSSGTIFRPEHRDIAKYYNIPVVDVGAYLYGQIYKENGNKDVWCTSNTVWRKYFKDMVHPVNAGYAVYAEKIRNYLFGELVSKRHEPAVYNSVKLPPETYMPNLLLDAYDVDFSEFDFETNNNFTVSNFTSFSTNYKGLASKNKGDTFTVTLSGTLFMLWTYSFGTATEIIYSIDGGKSNTVQLYRKNENYKLYPLAENLLKGEHTIKITHKDSNCAYLFYSMFISGDPSMAGDVKFTIDNCEQ